MVLPNLWDGRQYTTNSPFTLKNPFGTFPGYYTNQGVVAVPSTAVQGYIYCLDANKWVLAASAAPRGQLEEGHQGADRRSEEKARKYR